MCAALFASSRGFVGVNITILKCTVCGACGLCDTDLEMANNVANRGARLRVHTHVLSATARASLTPPTLTLETKAKGASSRIITYIAPVCSRWAEGAEMCLLH